MTLTVNVIKSDNDEIIFKMQYKNNTAWIH